MIYKKILGIFATFCVALGTAGASDSAIVWGGNPKVVNANSSVRMESEKIKLKIGPMWTSVICAFVFRNEGPSCKVKIDFPDQTRGSDPGKPSDSGAALSSFQLFVDGTKSKSVSTSEDPDEAGISWHEKEVDFTHRQTRIIVDQYKVRTGIAQTAGKIDIHEIGFLMHTGASWKGTIKKVTVLAQFDDAFLPTPVRVVPSRLLGVKLPTEYENWGDVKHNVVYYHAFVKPSIDGTNILFVARNLKPTKRSDVYLYFRTSERPLTRKRHRRHRLPRAEDSEQ